MAVTLGHLAAGELAAAESAMATVADGELRLLDVQAFWEPFRAAGFRYGEARIAPLFRACYPDNLWLRLRGVDSLITAGDDTAAVQELEALVALPGAFAHAGLFLAFHARLGRLDLSSAFAQAFAGDESLPKADRVRLGFEVAGALRAGGLRGPLFHELQRLAPLCVGDLALSTRLADIYMEIGERSSARDLLSQLPEPVLAIPLVKFYMIQLAPVLDRTEVIIELRSLNDEPSTDADYWIRFSYAADGYGDPALALEAVRKAMLHAPEPTVWLRIRLAQVLMGAGQHRAALSEIERLTEDDQAVRFSGQTLGNVALACERPELAARIARRWVALSPDDMQAQVMLCVYQRAAGDLPGVHAAALVALRAVQDGAALTAAQFRLFADSVRGTDGALETELAKAAAAQHPAEAEFRALAAPGAFAAKFLAPGPTLPQARKRGFFARFRRGG